MVMFPVGPELPHSEKCRNLNFSVPWSSTLRGEAGEVHAISASVCIIPKTKPYLYSNSLASRVDEFYIRRS